MSERKPDSNSTPSMEMPSQMMEWWAQQWMQNANPMTRLQLAWMQSVSEVMEQEANFLKAMADASQRLAECYDTHGGDPEKMGECYRSIANEISDHHMERMKKVAEMPNEFRRRIWEEI
ncbi:hypothetical protein [Halomonas sp. NO4]|uniref:hypothetical protein n=1 Tax=Halomonas sp. NO4 TaxID=2484813 RepID=UPI0013D173FD|nr:hypothetical protein [Halomonas sp. NO4]